MPLSPSARRAAALRAALRHPDALGVSALQAWAARDAQPRPAPDADPARAARWAAARAAEPSQAALAAAHDQEAGRRGPRPRWASDEAPSLGEPQPWRAPLGRVW